MLIYLSVTEDHRCFSQCDSEYNIFFVIRVIYYVDCLLGVKRLKSRLSSFSLVVPRRPFDADERHVNTHALKQPGETVTSFTLILMQSLLAVELNGR